MRTLIILLLVASSQISFAQSVKKTMKRIPDSGQNTSYTNTFGEDNDYSIYTPFYVDNGDGTITDTITGLMWQKTDGGEMTIDSAHKYVQQLNLATYSDWRLPSVSESFTLLNLDALNPSINTQFFPNTNAEYWWCLDTAYNNASKIWVTNAGGGQGPHPKSETISAGGNKRFHTRAVRDIIPGATLPSRFTDNGDSTITDNLTGLIWQKYASNDTMSWENALTRAESSTTAQNNDWRLPNIKEIASINNVKANNPSAYSSVFPNLKAYNFWSSTSQFNHASNAWYIDFKNFGLTSYMDKANRQAYIICVRNKTVTTHTSLSNDKSPLKYFFNTNQSELIIESNASAYLQHVEIFNAAGQLITEQSFDTASAEPLTRISSTNLANGTYVFRLQDNHGKLISGSFVHSSSH
ncbi:MAG: DUF1566 domain-containing protein [Chitinophagales bacterium]|jgi:hypothetical protein|nr:DUF1566 domain-containing protein [Chitinophagales bacterium]